MRKTLRSDGGWTLLEGMISLGIGAIFLLAVINTWIQTSSVWNQQHVQSRLRYQIEKAMERIKHDIRLSDGNGILFYPDNASTHTAILLPHAAPDANGFLAFSGDAIVWDQTIVYHLIASGGKTELRRTVFDSFQADPAVRQAQLDDTVLNGDGSAGPGNATTTALFSADSSELAITPQYPTFDGYGTALARSENTGFGSVRLAPGAHTIRFEVVDKNEDSTGYAMGLDSIAITPSGSVQEAEDLEITATSGDTALAENVSAEGAAWGGGRHLSYASNAGGDFVSFTVNHDQWMESNFIGFSRDRVSIEGTDPHLTIESRESQGLSPAWQAGAQTQVESLGGAILTDRSVRTVIAGANISKSATMVRVKFMAATNQPLRVNAAFFGVRSGATANFDLTNPVRQLYFANGTVAEGEEDGEGAVGDTGNTTVDIPTGHHAWSNWFEHAIDAGGAPPDHLVSFSVPNDTSWDETPVWTSATPTDVHSYLVNGDHAANLGDWALLAGYTAAPSIYATEQITGWIHTGTAVSQIYDTQMSEPEYNNLVWSRTEPAGCSAQIKVRSSDNDDMAGAPDWDSVTAHSASPASLGSLNRRRYVQYQVSLEAASPYTEMPEVDRVIIDWPGEDQLVEISGHFTIRPNYGVFRVLVDDIETVKALNVRLQASETFKEKDYSFELTSEANPRNTGK